MSQVVPANIAMKGQRRTRLPTPPASARLMLPTRMDSGGWSK